MNGVANSILFLFLIIAFITLSVFFIDAQMLPAKQIVFEKLCNEYFERIIKTGDITVTDYMNLRYELLDKDFFDISISPSPQSYSWGDEINVCITAKYEEDFPDAKGGISTEEFTLKYTNHSRMVHILRK